MAVMDDLPIKHDGILQSCVKQEVTRIDGHWGNFNHGAMGSKPNMWMGPNLSYTIFVFYKASVD